MTLARVSAITLVLRPSLFKSTWGLQKKQQRCKHTSQRKTAARGRRGIWCYVGVREHQLSPTRWWPLPPPPERATLTACPWWSGARGCGGSRGATGWRPAGGGCRIARAPRPECRRPGWSSCGPWRTSGRGAGCQSPDDKYNLPLTLFSLIKSDQTMIEMYLFEARRFRTVSSSLSRVCCGLPSLGGFDTWRWRLSLLPNVSRHRTNATLSCSKLESKTQETRLRETSRFVQLNDLQTHTCVV